MCFAVLRRLPALLPASPRRACLVIPCNPKNSQQKGRPVTSRPAKHFRCCFGFVGYAVAFFVDWPSSWIAARALERTSGGICCMLWAVLACSSAFLRTSSSELPRISKLHPGVTSLHFRTFVMGSLLAVGGDKSVGLGGGGS